jgi:CheY-like chemotaxis protein
MRVLIVEDQPKMAALVRRGLVEEGHAADVAGKGEDAVWMAEAHPYDAIVLDVMPTDRVRDVPPAPQCGCLDTGADVDGPGRRR